MSRFDIDNIGQRAVRDAILAPKLYGKISLNGRYVFVDRGRFASILQKRLAVDTIMQRQKNGATVAVEEKIVRWPGYHYKWLTLETMSCTVPGRESDGWMRYGEADWLNYVMCQETGDLLCHIIDFQALKLAFWPVADTFGETITHQINRTACRKVPLNWIKRNAPYHSQLLTADPASAEIVKRYSDGHYKRSHP